LVISSGACGGHTVNTMTGIADELTKLHERLDALDDEPATLGDWHRLEARAARLLIAGQHELARVQGEVLARCASEPRSPNRHSCVQQLVRILEELRIIRLCAEGRILELQAEAVKCGFSDRLAP
jgi:hypothetical protein